MCQKTKKLMKNIKLFTFISLPNLVFQGFWSEIQQFSKLGLVARKRREYFILVIKIYII